MPSLHLACKPTQETQLADQTTPRLVPNNAVAIRAIGAVVLAIVVGFWPDHVFRALSFAIRGLVEVAPLVVPGILLAAWIIASGADRHLARAFEGRVLATVFAASAIGAITPVCGVTVLPLMAGLLAAGVPLAPIMAFWLSSPVTDPAMLATTAATLGFAFAMGKTVAAFGLGVLGGMIAALFAERTWAKSALRNNRLTNQLSLSRCESDRKFEPRIWAHLDQRIAFARETMATTRLILICLIPAFIAEYALNEALTPGVLAAYVGEENWWAIPAAVFVGAPAYIDGYAALPLTRGLIENGMSPGAAMAFLVSGGVVSIWGAMAIFPVLKFTPFTLYLGLAITGSIIAGYVFEWAV